MQLFIKSMMVQTSGNNKLDEGNRRQRDMGDPMKHGSW